MPTPVSRLKSYSGMAALYGFLSLIGAALVQLFLPKLRVSVVALLALGIALLLVAAFSRRADIWAALAGPRGRYGSNTLAGVVGLAAVLVFANLLGGVNHRRFDLTAEGEFTLTPQTRGVLERLTVPVAAVGFFPPTAQFQLARQAAENLLSEYRFATRFFDYRFVDPDREPSLARQYGVKEYGTIVFEAQGRRKPLRLLDEQVGASPEQFFTGAILEATGVGQKRVCFLGGHGERNPKSAGRDGYELAAKGLTRDLYQVEALELSLTPEVPADCAALIVAGPEKELAEAEIRSIERYLERAGKAFFLADPSSPEGVRRILADWGVALGNGRVIDEGAYVSPEKATPAALRGSYPPVVVTRDLDSTYFPEATSVAPRDELIRRSGDKSKPGWPEAAAGDDSLAVLPLIVTTRLSRIETGSEAGRPGDSKAELNGPFALGCLVMASVPFGAKQTAPAGSGKITRLAVIGDSDFATNQHFRNGGNSDLFLNAVGWLTEEEHLIPIRPKPFVFRRLVIGDDASRFIRYSSVALLPLAVLAAGAFVWWRRR